jgi:hypothetical protein
VTLDKNDFIKGTRLCEWSTLTGLKVNSSKSINLILKESYGLDSTDTDHYKKKKISNNSAYYWIGIKEL